VVFLSVLLLLSCTAVSAEDQDPMQVRLFKVQMFLAQGGDAEGQFYVAEMYEKGLGTPQDMKQAHTWYSKSAEQGNPKAIERLAKWNQDQDEAAKQKDRAAAEARAAEALKAKQAEAAAKAKQQAEAEAAAKARAEAAAKARAESEAAAKAKQQAEAEAAAKARAEAAAKAPAKAKPPAETSAAAPKEPPAAKADNQQESGKDKASFSANPCKGPQAKFLSTCQ
jgi:membrane protein involved in colicin uptake